MLTCFFFVANIGSGGLSKRSIARGDQGWKHGETRGLKLEGFESEVRRLKWFFFTIYRIFCLDLFEVFLFVPW